MPESLNKKEDFAAIKKFIDNNFRHFNAYAVKAASESYVKHINSGGKMFLSMAGAMSTAELGITLAEMIRKGKVDGICCTGANLEEDVFNLVAHKHYERVPHYRQLSPKEEEALRKAMAAKIVDPAARERWVTHLRLLLVFLLPVQQKLPACCQKSLFFF